MPRIPFDQQRSSVSPPGLHESDSKFLNKVGVLPSVVRRYPGLLVAFHTHGERGRHHRRNYGPPPVVHNESDATEPISAHVWRRAHEDPFEHLHLPLGAQGNVQARINHLTSAVRLAFVGLFQTIENLRSSDGDVADHGPLLDSSAQEIHRLIKGIIRNPEAKSYLIFAFQALTEDTAFERLLSSIADLKYDTFVERVQDKKAPTRISNQLGKVRDEIDVMERFFVHLAMDDPRGTLEHLSFLQPIKPGTDGLSHMERGELMAVWLREGFSFNGSFNQWTEEELQHKANELDPTRYWTSEHGDWDDLNAWKGRMSRVNHLQIPDRRGVSRYYGYGDISYN
ncbi:hypothetical protein T439DRAFT_94079 [Meredithblackwellia eburnea MCA 4105]